MSATNPSWRLTVLIAAVAQFASAFPTRVIPTLGPAVTASAGLPAASVGYLASIGMAGFLVAAVAATPFVERFGPIRTLQASLLLGVLAMLTIAVATPAALALASLSAGLADGPTSAAANRALQASVPNHRRGFAFSLKMIGGPLGGMAAGLALPILAFHGDWRWGAAAAGLLVLMAIALMQPFRAELDAARDRSAPIDLAGLTGLRTIGGAWRESARVPGLRVLLASGAALSFAQGAWNTFLVTFAVLDLNIGLVAAGLLLSISLLAGVAGRIGLGFTADRIGASTVLAAASLTSALVWVALALAQPDWHPVAFALLACLGGAAIIGWMGLQHAEIARLAPPPSMTAVSAAAVAIGGLGFLVSGVVMAALVQATGSYRPAFAALAALAIATALLLWREDARR